MIVIVLGMHKSGTTLVAKTLHESGINMGVSESGDYPKIKYEDSRVAKITKQLLYGQQKRHSLELPPNSELTDNSLNEMYNYVKMRTNNWGFKFPDVTLCYDAWKMVLPEGHIAIGVKRDRKDIVAHYKRRKRHDHSEKVINLVIDYYNSYLDQYKVPTMQFEDYINNGPGCLEDILGIKLKDCRRSK